MPKNKVYEHDYEWSGQENESKGVNINEKNPWNRPQWGTKPKKDHSGPQSSYATQPERFATMEELQRQHQWEKPDWATVQKKGSNNSVLPTNDNKDIIKDPIPKPMLKKTAAGVASGILGASTATSQIFNNKKSKATEETEREIAEMERRIEEARKKKVALEQQKLLEEAEEAAARQKHTVEESKLERARRLAKEKEEARWRATLAERILREKEQREQARLAALHKSNTSAVKSSDAVWEKTQQEQQEQYEERVRQEARKRQEAIEEELMIAKGTLQHEQQKEQLIARVENSNDQGNDEEDIEEIIEEYIEEYDEDDMISASVEGTPSADGTSNIDEIQRQIDELRKQLEMT
jgi:hypothetical protein